MKYLTLSQQRDGLPVPVQREVTALKALQGHPNILKYHGLYQNVRLETMCLIKMPCSWNLV